MNIERARELRRVISGAMQSVDDGTAASNPRLFPEWGPDSVEYTVGLKVQYEGVLYKVLQAHTSQASWTPTAAPSLFAEVLIPDPTVISEWKQPDSTNPYMKGDKVTHNGKTWICDIDNNVWEPGVYGWTEV